MVASLVVCMVLEPRQADRVDDLIEELDHDGNGRLSFQEAFADLGVEEDEHRDDVIELFKKSDKDRDGLLDKKEVKRMMYLAKEL